MQIFSHGYIAKVEKASSSPPQLNEQLLIVQSEFYTNKVFIMNQQLFL